MVFGVAGDLSVEPFGRDKGVCHLDFRKLDFRHDQGRKRRGKDVKFDTEIWRGLGRVVVIKLWVIDGNDISFLGYDNPVRFFKQMMVGGFVEWKVVLLPRHQAASLVGQIIGVVRPADTHDRRGVEVGLLNDFAGIGFKVFGQFFDGIFLFDFHVLHNRFNSFQSVQFIHIVRFYFRSRNNIM